MILGLQCIFYDVFDFLALLASIFAGKSGCSLLKILHNYRKNEISWNFRGPLGGPQGPRCKIRMLQMCRKKAHWARTACNVSLGSPGEEDTIHVASCSELCFLISL